ncbi:arylamine N-acetyltransferase [Staphylococcus arlettae]|uniref:Arylamine N-acetyltransferase n=3 Tax=Staphylococcus TaxID=1279 RepID=A0A1W5QD71_9STAP|nr:arylamine N-acetyltransferase [Staphylococcus arlettae]APY23737.1 arylamine N-acetyltransferase [Staphylococcus arlettae]PTH22494.1 arylamine N-acetyltransferase [Staphylococcus arlettae]PTH28360.1 arylamine N-acetyltransferase [Staphylococcus arlettae]PTH55227.1 arylamine N-acetyltransferase [Staphylococcus arlettae]PTH56949.1 arylamine N-acetyltransferase [Staphylococcus arlettae]
MTDFSQLEDYINADLGTYSEVNLTTLNHLIQQYVLHVPFENINVQNNQPIALDDESMLYKIIVEQRGGFCYEQNRLFRNFLAAKGFSVKMVAATIHTGDGWAMEGSHMSLIVTLPEGEFVADVGYADVPQQALPLAHPTIVEDVNGYFKIEWIDETNFQFLKYDGEAWVIQYQATNVSQTLADFAAGIEFNQHDPQSIFVRELIVSKAKVDGRVTMSKRNITISTSDQKEKIAIDNINYRTLLAYYFGIENIKIKTFDE